MHSGTRPVSRGAMLQVSLQLPNKRIVELSVPEASPVTMLHQAAAEATGERFPPSSCHIFFNGSRLGNNMTLDYYRIPLRAKLLMTRRLRSASGTTRSGASASDAAVGGDGGLVYGGGAQAQHSSQTGRPMYGAAAGPAPSTHSGPPPTSSTHRRRAPAAQGSSTVAPHYNNNGPPYGEGPVYPDDDTAVHPEALHRYRVRELEMEVRRAQADYSEALSRIEELEGSVDRLQRIAQRAVETSHTGPSSLNTSAAYIPPAAAAHGDWQAPPSAYGGSVYPSTHAPQQPPATAMSVYPPSHGAPHHYPHSSGGLAPPTPSVYGGYTTHAAPAMTPHYPMHGVASAPYSSQYSPSTSTAYMAGGAAAIPDLHSTATMGRGPYGAYNSYQARPASASNFEGATYTAPHRGWGPTTTPPASHNASAILSPTRPQRPPLV